MFAKGATDDESFYPTYEEWKPDTTFATTSIVKLFILPMRNGNSMYSSVYKSSRRLFILPMRNGNLNILSESRIYLNSFYPTYEEWKPTEAPEPIRVTVNLFILPMRNGNF